MPSVAIETQGCKLNQADSMKLVSQFQAAGFSLVDTSSKCDLYVINTCTVTHVADRKARHAVRFAKRNNPNATLVVTGCYAERDKEAIENMEEVDLVLGNANKQQIVGIITETFPSLIPSGGELSDYQLPDKTNRNRAMLKIQEGCNQICSYCIVPKVRGRERSVPVASLVESVERFVSEGFSEVVLTGTQLGSYGFDLDGISLAEMISEILNKTTIPRLRVSSLQAQELSTELLHLWREERLCPHFHIPLQSGNDFILRKMRRRYNSFSYQHSIERIRKFIPDAAITTDVIVGFPGESELAYGDTKALVKSIEFSDVHVFKFSSRPGTTAFFLEDDVAPPEKSRRSSEIIGISRESFAKFRRGHHGRRMKVLWEKTGSNLEESAVGSGLTENYIRVRSENRKTRKNLETVEVTFDPDQPYGAMVVND